MTCTCGYCEERRKRLLAEEHTVTRPNWRIVAALACVAIAYFLLIDVAM